jgi:integrase
MIGSEEGAGLTDIPNIRQQGIRLGNWLTREQAKELLAVPDRSTLKGKRDYCILALLVGCALRRQELAHLSIEEIQLRENRWVIADLRGKGGRVRTVAMLLWTSRRSTPIGRSPRPRNQPNIPGFYSRIAVLLPDQGQSGA